MDTAGTKTCSVPSDVAEMLDKPASNGDGQEQQEVEDEDLEQDQNDEQE